MDEKERLLGELDAARARMRAVVEQIERQREVFPGWTVRDVLAHIAGWDVTTTEFIRAHASGDESAIAIIRDIDAYNAQLIEVRQNLNNEQIRAEWECVREQLKATIADLSPERLATDMRLPLGACGPVTRLVRVMINHEHEHAEEVEAIVRNSKA